VSIRGPNQVRDMLDSQFESIGLKNSVNAINFSKFIELENSISRDPLVQNNIYL